MTRRGLFSALLGAVAAGCGISKASATDRLALVADDWNETYKLLNPASLQFAAQRYASDPVVTAMQKHMRDASLRYSEVLSIEDTEELL